MALTWDARGCEDPEALMEEPQYDTTTAMVFACMFVDIGTISKESYIEFTARVILWEQLLGNIRGDGYGPLTLADVKRYIGLKTNVLTKTRKVFEKRYGDLAMGQTMARVREMDKELTK